MKRIEAFIQPHRLNKIVSALHQLPHFPGFTVLNAHGQGHGRGAGGHFHYSSDDGLLFHSRLALVVVCEDFEAEEIAATIARAAHTGTKGDGMVVISDIAEIIRVRTGIRSSGSVPPSEGGSA